MIWWGLSLLDPWLPLPVVDTAMDCLFLDRVVGFVFWFVCLLVVIGLVSG